MSEAVRPRRMPIVVRIVLVTALVLLAALLSQPWWLAPVLGDYLSRTSGREVHFDSARIGLTMSLAPVVVLRGVRIANATWADTRRPLAALEEATLQLSWHRHAGRWVVTHAMFRDGELNFAQLADGSRNWRLRHPEDRGPGHFWFFAVEPHRASLSFAHAGIGLAFQAVASDMRRAHAVADDLVDNITFDGVFHGIAFEGHVATGRVLSMMDTGHWFALRGTAAIKGMRLDIDGRAADLMRDQQADAEAVLEGDSLAALRPLLGERYLQPHAFHVSGRVHATPDHYELDDAQARIGATDLRGMLAWSSNGAQRNAQVDLRSSSADMADLLWLAGRDTGENAGTKPVANPAAASPAFDVSAASKAIRDVNAGFHFEAQHLRVAAVPALQSLKVQAVLAGNRLDITAFNVGLGGGHSTGVLALDLRNRPARADLRMDTEGVRIENLMPHLDDGHRITGALRAHLALKASGDDIAALRASVAGNISATLSDGTIARRLDALMGLEGGKLVRSMGRGDQALRLPCAAMTVEASAGIALVRSLVVASANTRLTGSGTLDLRTADIDLALTPESVRPGLFELNRSIRLSGRLPKPQRALVARLAPVSSEACGPDAP
ncbi:MAG: AsmA-like C-terminal region-containing protein [Pseudomonadota bacterium]